MRDCWRHIPEQRPAWTALRTRIEAILDDLDDNPDDDVTVNNMAENIYEILQDPPEEKC